MNFNSQDGGVDYTILFRLLEFCIFCCFSNKKYKMRFKT